MLDHDAGRREPAINLPVLLTASIVVLILIHLARGWISDRADLELLFGGGFVPVQWTVALGWADADAAIAEARRAVTDPEMATARVAVVRYLLQYAEPHAWSFLTYALLHGSWLHVGLNCVWLAAFGTPVVRRCGSARAAILAVATALGGALAYWVANPLSPQVMIGASGIVSGFMGAAAMFVFEPRAAGANARSRGAAAPVLSLLRNRNALGFLAVWFLTNIIAGVFAAPLGLAEGGIAWQAHIGGFLTGLLLFPALDPARMRALRT